MKTTPQEPIFSAFNEATEPDRLNRLRSVWGYALGLADNSGNANFEGIVAELHDYKGELTVRWRVTPTLGEREFFVRAWESSVGDGCPNVQHEEI